MHTAKPILMGHHVAFFAANEQGKLYGGALKVFSLNGKNAIERVQSWAQKNDYDVSACVHDGRIWL